MILLESAGTGGNNFPEGEEETHEYFDCLNEEFEVPAERTYYNCKLFKIPEFTKKQHMVKVKNHIVRIRLNLVN